MPKSKKQKTNHHSNHQPYSARNKHPSANDKNAALSHEEIWDDSALLRSWDDAVKEYEFYHSIHARREDVDEVLRKAEEAEEAERKTRLGLATNSREQPSEDIHNDRNSSSDEEGEVSDNEHNNEKSADPPDNADPSSDAARTKRFQSQWTNTIKALQKAPRPDLDTTSQAQFSATRDWLQENDPIVYPDDSMYADENFYDVDIDARFQAIYAWLDDINGKVNEDEKDVSMAADTARPSVEDTAGQRANVIDRVTTANGVMSTMGQAPISAAADQTLENIKMAYYWAGYYSGLYDGQRQSQGQGQKQ